MNCGGLEVGALFDAHLQSGNWHDEGQLYPGNCEYDNAAKRKRKSLNIFLGTVFNVYRASP